MSGQLKELYAGRPSALYDPDLNTIYSKFWPLDMCRKRWDKANKTICTQWRMFAYTAAHFHMNKNKPSTWWW